VWKPTVRGLCVHEILVLKKTGFRLLDKYCMERNATSDDDDGSSSKKAKRTRDESENFISSSSSAASLSSPAGSNSKNRRTQQAICTSTAPGILSSASGAFMMTQDRDNVFRLFDALSQEVLWMCGSRKELELIEYCPVSNKIVARATVFEPETAKTCQLAVWDLNTGNMLLLPKATQRLIVRCINHAGTRITVSEGSEYYRIWDMDSGSELFRFQLNAMYSSMACCFARDDSKVAIVGHTLGGTNIVIDIWEVAPRLGHQMFSTNVKSSGLICQVTSSCNNKVFAMATYHDIFVVDLSSANVSKLLVTAEFWYGICFGCDDSCIVTLSLDDGSQALGVYRIADSVTLFRVPVQFYRANFGRILVAVSSKIYLIVREGGPRRTVCVFDYATGAKLQQSSVFKYPLAQLYVPEPEMILM
jgi:hypothetical protein